MVTVIYNYTLPNRFTIVLLLENKYTIKRLVQEYLGMGYNGWYTPQDLTNKSNVWLVWVNFTDDIYISNGTLIECIMEYPILMMRAEAVVNGTLRNVTVAVGLQPLNMTQVTGRNYVDSIASETKSVLGEYKGLVYLYLTSQQ